MSKCAEVDKILDSIIDSLDTYPTGYPLTVEDIGDYTALALDEKKFPKCSETELQRFHDVFMFSVLKRINTMKKKGNPFDKDFEKRYKNLLDKSTMELQQMVKAMNQDVEKKGKGWKFGGKIEDRFGAKKPTIKNSD